MAEGEEVVVEDKESQARAQLPFRAEYCKTGRAKCKKCSEPMEANSLKLAIMTKSRFHDGYDASYNHVTCFFQIKRPTSVAEIRHFETLKYEDQKMIEEAVETKGMSILGSEVKIKSDKGSKDKKAKKRSSKNDVPELLINYDDFLVEYAKSGRSTCKSCEKKIEKDLVRLGKMDYDAETPYKAGPVPRWYHIDCFVKSLEELEFYGNIEKVKGFADLEGDDRKLLKSIIKPIKLEEIKEKRLKVEDKKQPSEEEEKEEKLLKKQSKRYYALREFVSSMKRKDIEDMMDYMDQKSNYKSSTVLIDMAADVLLFGALKKCPVCKSKATIELRGSSYICTKGFKEGEPCSYEDREPKRDVPDVPDELIEKYPFFESYRFKGGARIFPTKFVKAVEQKEAEVNNIVQEGAPLDGLAIGVISWKTIKFDKTKVQKKIITLGGRLLTSLDKSIFVILSSKDELTKESPKVEVAKALEVPFATADFLFKIETKEDVVPQVKKCLIDGWQGDLEARFNKMISKQPEIDKKNGQ